MASNNTPTPARRKPTFVEDMLLGVSINDVPRLVPGIGLSAVLVVSAISLTNWANAWVSDLWGLKSLLSYIMVAIVIGILVRNTVGLQDALVPGVSFCLRKLLRLGIILMGIRLSILDVLKIGGFGIPIVVAAILTGLVVTTYVTRLLKLPDRLGTLIAIGTGICGVSAIVATAPGIRAKDEEIAYAVANITVFGIIATLVYPYLGHLVFGGNVTMVGLFTGTSIHDTSQVAAAGLIYDQTFEGASRLKALDIATVTKLVRNSMMMVAIPAITYVYARRMRGQEGQEAGAKVRFLQLVPLFIIGFLAMAVIRSIGDANLEAGSNAYGVWDKAAWGAVIARVRDWSGYILATAMAGVGLGTSFRAMKGLGLKPFLVGILAATSVGAVSAVLVLALGARVSF